MPAGGHSVLQGMDEAVADAARRFRRAAEQGGLVSVGLQAFPRGACGDTSELLGQYLLDSGLGEWTYRFGWFSGHSHAWLERDGVVVDITADQFAEGLPPVIVTLDHSWHARFDRMGSHVAGLDYYVGADCGVAAKIAADYRTLKARADSART